ncbi:MAG: sialic acid O-acetyltransferase [Candidatus Cloacimonetes bacterium]|nr:sialic acid O-acetyltransferase [Candidatus Cloacimonadota bacterium]
MKEKIIIIGGKGSAVVLAEQILHAVQNFNADYELLGFCIDDPLLGSEIAGFPILCKRDELTQRYNAYSDVKYFFALYKPTCMEERVQLFQDMELPRDKFTNFIHPLSYVARSVKMGVGNVICSNVTVNCNATMGDYNTLNGNVLFGHDSSLGNCNILAGSVTISSEIEIGNGNFIGLNSTIRDRVKIGDFSIIGMASTVLHDVASRTTVVGSPAKQVIK